MKLEYSTSKISIMQAPYNVDYAVAFGLVFKLSYVFEKRENPHLEIFLNDDEAKAREWEIYGTLLDDTDERFANVRFGAIGEEREFQICSLQFRIKFENIYSDFFIFSNGSKDLVLKYDFLVKSID